MNNSFLKLLALAFKIWMVAVIVNGVLGALAINGFAGNSKMGEALVMMIVLSTIFSIPSFITVLFIIWVLAGFARGKVLFWSVMAAGLIPAVLIFASLMGEFDEGVHREEQYLLCTVIIAGITGVTAFYRSLLKLGDDQGQNLKA